MTCIYLSSAEILLRIEPLKDSTSQLCTHLCFSLSDEVNYLRDTVNAVFFFTLLRKKTYHCSWRGRKNLIFFTPQMFVELFSEKNVLQSILKLPVKQKTCVGELFITLILPSFNWGCRQSSFVICKWISFRLIIK